MKQIIIRHSDYSFFCFDFDGVILDTIDLKAEGLLTLLVKYLILNFQKF